MLKYNQTIRLFGRLSPFCEIIRLKGLRNNQNSPIRNLSVQNQQ